MKQVKISTSANNNTNSVYDDTFDTMSFSDLESNDGVDDAQGTENKQVSLEHENDALRKKVASLEEQVLRAQAEVEFWKHHEEVGTNAPVPTTPNNQQIGLWEKSLSGLRLLVTPESARQDDSSNGSNRAENSAQEHEHEYPSRLESGLHHRKTAPTYLEKLNIPTFSFNTKTSEEKREVVSLMKSHASDRDEASESTIDTNDEVNDVPLGGDEPSFYQSVLDRGSWLVGLLVLQSFSSFILKNHEQLLSRHAVIVRFLTMLVGAGGNAGNQASVRVIRGLATGKVNDDNLRPYIKQELCAGVILSAVLGVAGCIRAAVFFTPFFETIAITSSLVMIVGISILIGMFLPLLMKMVNIDPAHSSTCVQVIMDISGVAITVFISSLILK